MSVKIGRNDPCWCGSGKKYKACHQAFDERMDKGEYLPIEEIQSLSNKVLRIESLQPVIKNKYLKFNREHKTLIKQLTEFPMGKNDDAPDALQMAVQLAQSIKGIVTSTKYKSVIKRKFRMGKGAY